MNPYKYFVSAELNNNPLCGIDKYKDILNLATGAITRKIKKLVLTGRENINAWTGAGTGYFYIPANGIIRFNATDKLWLSNQYSTKSQSDPWGNYVISCNPSAQGRLVIKNTDYPTVADFKAYLASQYAAGTPVTVWYVIAEPDTETITVPTGLSGTVEGFLNQSGTPTPTNPIYPTANTAKGWYSINAYKRSVSVWNTHTGYERSDGTWT